ncbi:hypothetical protein [Anaerobacterium chartisolvens]|nr:hypothetical protein [Anaerobacterium chartisolvens]
MSDRCGGFGGFFKNDELLWFIILFLLLFYCNYGFGPFSNTACGAC